MASKKAMQVEIDNLRDALHLMEASRELVSSYNSKYTKQNLILKDKVEQLREALKEQNELSTELHLDNAQLNNTIFDQVIHTNAQSDFIAAQSDYITHLTNR